MTSSPGTQSEFLDLVAKSDLVDAERLRGLDLPADPAQCAATLIAKGLLTKFQAKQLLNGRHRGFKLGSYRILDQIGQGAMGTVFLGEHVTLRRKVAIKVLTLPKSGNATLTVERFLREARSAAALDHRNIVRLHDVGHQADTHYIVMEYVDGRTLDEVITETGPISPSRAIDYIAQAAAGLQHAYEKGFIHRDIKPSNLILANDGTLKILDMGLARPVDATQEALTEMMDKGAVVGTADFISPEQAMSSPMDIRSDIYSLGATFFVLVTGTTPFTGNTTQKLLQHQMKEAPSVTTMDRTFPAGVSSIVGKMLAKKPEQRYATPAEVIAALAPWLSQRSSDRMRIPSEATEAATSQSLETTVAEFANKPTQRLADAPSVKRSRRWMALAAAGVAVVAAIIVVVMNSGSPPAPASVQASAAPVPTPPVVVPVLIPAVTPPPPTTPDPLPENRIVYKLTLPKKPVTITGHSAPPDDTGAKKWTVDEKVGDGNLPSGWHIYTFDKNSAGEFRIQDRDGSMAMSVRNIAGPASTVIGFPAMVFPTGKLRISFNYLVEGEGNALLRMWQTAPTARKVRDMAKLPSASVWSSFEQIYNLDGGTAGRFEFAPQANATLWVRNLVISEGILPGQLPHKSLTSTNFEAMKPLQVAFDDIPTVQMLRHLDGQALPSDVSLNEFIPNISTAFRIADVDGARALGFQLVKGARGLAVHFSLGNVLSQASPHEVLTIRIRYHHEGTGNASATVQWNRSPYSRLVTMNLEPTGPKWKTADLTFVRPADYEKFTYIVDAGYESPQTPRAQGMIDIASVEVLRIGQ